MVANVSLQRQSKEIDVSKTDIIFDLQQASSHEWKVFAVKPLQEVLHYIIQLILCYLDKLF